MKAAPSSLLALSDVRRLKLTESSSYDSMSLTGCFEIHLHSVFLEIIPPQPIRGTVKCHTTPMPEKKSEKGKKNLTICTFLTKTPLNKYNDEIFNVQTGLNS